jgi:hypothetical protein
MAIYMINIIQHTIISVMSRSVAAPGQILLLVRLALVLDRAATRNNHKAQMMVSKIDHHHPVAVALH